MKHGRNPFMSNPNHYTGKVISYSVTGAGQKSAELVFNLEPRPGAESRPFSVGMEAEPQAFASFSTLIATAYYHGTPLETAWHLRPDGSSAATALFVPPDLARKHRQAARKPRAIRA